MTEIASRPYFVQATVGRRACGAPSADPSLGREPAWSLRVTYRQSHFDAPDVTSVLPLSDEFAAFQIDLFLRAVSRGETSAARLLFAYLHEEWGHARMVRRDPAWDALFSYLAPLAAASAA